MRAKNFSSSTKNGVFFSVASGKKKDTIFGAARKFFGPSYFVMALVKSEKLSVGSTL